MSQNNLPDGWDEERVQRLIVHYGEQNDDQALLEDEGGVEESTETVMTVPHELVPQVRELIAKHRGS
jgi:hypothetical protein